MGALERTLADGRPCAAGSAPKCIQSRPDQVRTAPPVLPPGAELAVLEGDPMAASGDFTIRLKMPAGYRISPRWHPRRENVTVVSASFKLRRGDSFDISKMTEFPAGSFAFMDPGTHHYGMAVGETVVQVHGAAPFQSTTSTRATIPA